MTREPGTAAPLPAGRTLRLLLLVALFALVECGAAPGSALGQYQPAPQYRPVPQYQPPVPVPQAPVYKPGPYDNYNPYLVPGYQSLKKGYGSLESRHGPLNGGA